MISWQHGQSVIFKLNSYPHLLLMKLINGAVHCTTKKRFHLKMQFRNFTLDQRAIVLIDAIKQASMELFIIYCNLKYNYQTLINLDVVVGFRIRVVTTFCNNSSLLKYNNGYNKKYFLRCLCLCDTLLLQEFDFANFNFAIWA